MPQSVHTVPLSVRNGSPTPLPKNNKKAGSPYPSLQRQNATLQSPEDSDEELSDVEEDDPQHDLSQKARLNVDYYQHDPSNPFRFHCVHKR
jgi:hypothetical protein